MLALHDPKTTKPLSGLDYSRAHDNMEVWNPICTIIMTEMLLNQKPDLVTCCAQIEDRAPSRASNVRNSSIKRLPNNAFHTMCGHAGMYETVAHSKGEKPVGKLDL